MRLLVGGKHSLAQSALRPVTEDNAAIVIISGIEADFVRFNWGRRVDIQAATKTSTSCRETALRSLERRTC
jgi:hypothetical protein